MKVALYVRVSTSDQDVDNQIAQLSDFAHSQDWTITCVYSDTGSGSDAARKGFNEMMMAASQRKFDILLFWSLDRLTREGVGKTIKTIETLDHYGVRIRSYTEPYLDTLGIFREAVIGILACIAKQERLRISERTKAGMQRARINGSKLGRPRLDEDTIFSIHAMRDQGHSWRQIAKHLKIGKETARQYARKNLSEILTGDNHDDAEQRTPETD